MKNKIISIIFVILATVMLPNFFMSNVKYSYAADDSDDKRASIYIGQEYDLEKSKDEILVFSEDGIVKYSDGKLIGVGEGTTKIYATKKKSDGSRTGKKILEITVKKNEQFANIKYDDSSIPKHIVGDRFSVNRDEFKNNKAEWKSENESVAKVDQDGNVTAVNSGTTSIVVDVVDSYGGEYRFYIPITICSPHFEKTVKCAAINEIVEISVLDLPGNITGVNASNKNKILIDHYSQDKVYIKGMVKGTTTLTVWVGSYQISCKIIVTNPMLKKYYGFYPPKKSFKLYYKSASKYSDVTWSSSNNKIAVVDNKGVVKTKKYGGVLINCTVDGREIQFHLGVTTKKAVKVLRYGLTKVGHNKYSQARRMSKGYYDCSSYVYRCSRAVNVKLVRKTSWAPVAAEIGQYYYRRHKIVKTKSKEYSDKNLRPGDLILFGGKKAPRNGRFKRIYHIAFYIGNGETMESSSRFNNVSIIHRGYIKKKEVPVVARPY